MGALLKPKDQKQRRKVKNHSIRNKRRTKRGMVIDLDKSARHEVVVERDQDTCQRCGIHNGDWIPELLRYAVIQWCHVHTREYYCLRWEPDNSYAGCDRCHVWFDQHKVLGFDWFSKKWPERWKRILRVLQSGNNKTTDADIRALWEARRIL